MRVRLILDVSETTLDSAEALWADIDLSYNTCVMHSLLTSISFGFKVRKWDKVAFHKIVWCQNVSALSPAALHHLRLPQPPPLWRTVLPRAKHGNPKRKGKKKKKAPPHDGILTDTQAP